jgi:thiosulfate dehydrogenase
MKPSPFTAALLALYVASGSPADAQTHPAKSTVAIATVGGAIETDATFRPPSDNAMPTGPYGDMVKLGREIFLYTGQYAQPFVGNSLHCSNCHLDAGRLANSAPLWAAWVAYPRYRTKNRRVDTYADRLRDCFLFSMNGKEPPFGDKVLVALETYSAWLARGAPVGADMPGRLYGRPGKPALPPDYARGEVVYQHSCALCHGADGAGQSAAGRVVFPPLWGDDS